MSANELTNTLLIRIPLEIPGSRCWRQNVIAARAGERFIRAGLPGQADISGILPNGRRLEVEVKAGSDRLGRAQVSFRDMILACRGVHVVARDVDKTIAEIRSAMDSTS